MPGIVATSLIAAVAQARDKSADAVSQCDALRSVAFAGIQDAPTQITETKIAAASTNDSTEYCQVTGHVKPSTAFVLRMPLNGWNGKFLQLGCGGMCGTTDHIKYCADALHRGYACIVSDRGHSAADKGWWGSKDLESNLQSMLEWARLSTHVTAVAGKAIVEHFYRRAPLHAYFTGCSGGGHGAMEEAQNFPWDFDGVIAGAPCLNIPRSALLWNFKWLIDAQGRPVLSKSDLELLHAAVVASCDMNDGIKDGLIGDPRKCQFKPQSLLCTSANESKCLAHAQVEAVNRVYDGPTDSSGSPVGYSMSVRGSELQWEPYGLKGEVNKYFTDWIRYLGFQAIPGVDWTGSDFEYGRDDKRLAFARSVLAALNPDLRSFKSGGGKLIMYTGWNDAGEGVLDTIDYYETVERTMGGRSSTQDFFRLFVVPGMTHCVGGEGPWSIDYLSALESWVEQGRPPDKLIGRHLAKVDDAAIMGQQDPAQVQFSRPIYPYPIETRYSGHGDTADAASFGPVEP